MAAPKGNKYTEKWNEQKAKELFDKALVLAKNGATSLVRIAIELNTYDDVFDYLADKFEVFRPVKNMLLKIIANNLFERGLNNEVNTGMAIFGLKANHGWEDKQTVKHEGITEQPKINIKKITVHKNKK